MVSSIKVILDQRRSKNDGSYPISFQICFQRKTRTRSSKIYVRFEDWDDSKKEIKKSHPQSKKLNQRLKYLFADIQSELLLADDNKIANYLKPAVNKSPLTLPPTKTVYQFAEKLIHDLKNANKFGNAWVYESTVNALKGYHPVDDLLFEQIDYQFLDAYQRHLKKGKATTSLINSSFAAE